MSRPDAYIGKPIERLEDLRFLRGRGQYVDDLECAGALHAVVVRSAVAHGRIRSIDTAAARTLPGVHAVFTATDLGAKVPVIPVRSESQPSLDQAVQPVLAHGKVRYVGEPVAFVVAETAALAEDAADAVTVDIDPLRAVIDRAGAEAGDVLLFEHSATNTAGRFTGVRGDAAKAFAAAPYVRRERFRVQRYAPVPLETRGLLARWDAHAERLTLAGAAKVPFWVRSVLAAMMALPEQCVDVIETDIGGGFGARGEFFPEDFLVAFAARRLGRPVKWIEDRREHFLSTAHAREVDCELEIACRRDGVILALRGQAWTNAGAYIRPNVASAPRNIAQMGAGPYRIADLHMEVSVLLSNKTPTGSYRGPGRFEIDFCRERLIDLACADLGLDRAEMRRRNLLTDAEMPHALPIVLPHGKGGELDSGDYRVTFDRCLAEIRWDEKASLQGRLIDGRYHGLAIGCYVEGGAIGPRENARLVLDSEGMVTVYVGTSALGQGQETVFAQIAADALGIPIEHVKDVFHGSTTCVEEGFGSFGSRASVMGGCAIAAAAEKLKDSIREAAAARFGCPVSAIEIIEGMRAVRAGELQLPLHELAGRELAAEGTFAAEKRTYSYGAHAAHVAVDPRTGQVEVLEYVAVEDVGRILNPSTLHGQALGAIVQGLGGSLLEELIYDEHGQLLTASLASYLLPSMDDYPDIRAVALELYPSPLNPLGAKGGGEGGIIPVGGVIANAVACALGDLGVQPFELPLSPPRVWQLIEDARGSRRQAQRTAR
ncbi:MAG: xanthine dehydrogenase family protein molybdopterin-binding subunit [Burkholderiales bacterium]|nr:xanthine dehydrogenase family protein molybdopterin-binding subunit [Burkholderiales bacterium]